jgi:hypothetical protein
MSNIIEVSKNLAAASSNKVGAVSTAATSVVTVNSSNMPLDTQRRIIFTSTAADTSTLTLLFTGTREGGGSATESVKGSTAGAGTNATSISDFLTITSIGISSNANVPILVGTSSVGGTVWQSANVFGNPVQIGGSLTFSSTANSMTASIDITHDNPFVPPNPYGGGPGGIPSDLDASVPIVFTSTAFSGVGSNTWQSLNIVGGGSGQMVPIRAWRLTLVSSSSGAGTVTMTTIQAGVN